VAPSLSVAPSDSSVLAWAEIRPAGPTPTARQDHTWTVDGDGQKAYLFGGLNASGPTNDLWAFDLATDSWTELHTTGEGPGARFGHTGVWVPGFGLVIWSGQGSSSFFDDVWAYDPQTNSWSELPSLGAVPEARYGSCASIGPDGEMWISHGFTEDDGRFADTRSYDFATGTWTDRTPSGDLPVKRCLHDCTWSPAGQLILYGGQTTGTAALGDLWTYDPQSVTWTQVEQVYSPPPRQLYALASDGVLVFGGGSLDGGYLDDMWAINSVNTTEPQLYAVSTTGGPSARSGATLITDAKRRELLFGGMNEAGLLGDLWALGSSDGR